MTCFEGGHLAMTLGIGIPSIIFLVAGFPLALAVWLWRSLKRGHLQPGSWAFTNYSTLWDGFRRRLCFWLPVRLLRQLALLAVIIGLHSQGTTLQALGAWMVAFVMLMSHMLLVPFLSGWIQMQQSLILGALAGVIFLKLVETAGSFSEGLVVRALNTARAMLFSTVVLSLGIMLGLRVWLATRRWVTGSDTESFTWAQFWARVRGAGQDASRKIRSSVSRRLSSMSSLILLSAGSLRSISLRSASSTRTLFQQSSSSYTDAKRSTDDANEK